MLNNMRKNVSTVFPLFRCGTTFRRAQELFDTVQTMNISQTLNFSALPIVLELVNLASYLAVDMSNRLISPISTTVVLFLLFMVSNLLYCGHIFKLERNRRVRRMIQYHTYVFTSLLGLFCLLINHYCLKSRITAGSVPMFYVYVVAEPSFTFTEAATAMFVTAGLVLPSFVTQWAPVALYSDLFLYSFISLFLSQVRCRIIGNNLRMLREARDEQVYLQSRADNDPLTRIPNRDGFALGLKALMPEAIRLQIPVTVIMVDIDYSKQYNDTFGHVAGDECLKRVADALAAHIHQEKDLICRLGREGFEILLYRIKSEDAVQVADRLRLSVTDLRTSSANYSISPYVIISVGICSAIPTSLETYPSMVQAADDEPYYAKNRGKNMVSFHELPPEQNKDTATPTVIQYVAASYELPRL